MRVFVTGASGHIGSALVPELLAAGHQVVGLARSDQSAAALEAAGAEALRGHLDDLDGLRAAAAAADGVIHLAFKHDLMASGAWGDAVDHDLLAIQAMGGALDGSGKPFVGTSGTLMLVSLGLDRAGTELDVAEAGPRVDAENHVIGLAANNVRSAVVRLPPLVHSDLDRHGFGPILIRLAREKGFAGYVGDGANRWPAGNTRDAARLYRLALEGARAGTRLHAVDDEGVPFRRIAETIAAGLGVPARSVAPEDAAEHFTFLGPLVSMDDLTSSALTREWLGWQPQEPGLIADLEAGHYFS